jgi:hypothetical protein
LLKVPAIKNPPSAVTATPDRAVELGVGGRAAIPRAAHGACPGDTGDHADEHPRRTPG